MPYYRRRRAFRRTRRTRRYARRVYMRPSTLNRTRLPAGKIFRHKFSVTRTDLSTVNIPAAQAGTISAFGALNFMLSNIAGYQDFTAHYDQFRINGVAIQFVPRFNTSSLDGISSTVTVGVPMVYACVDLDDSTVPTTSEEILERTSVRKMYMNRPKKMFLRPRLQWETGTTTNSVRVIMPRRSRLWVDCNEASVAVYNGIKYVIDLPFTNNGTAFNADIGFNLLFTYYVTFMGQR